MDGPEESLDPADWPALRRLGHQMVDDMLGWIETVRDRPVWQPVPEDVRVALRTPAPRLPEGAESAYRDFQTQVLPYPMGNVHPRFWAWVMGGGTPFGVLAEFLAATMNPNCGGGNHVAPLVEAQVLDWCKEMLGFPATGSGLLVSGGSVANMVALGVARNSRAGVDVRKHGVRAAPPLTVYGSEELHSSVQKSVELLGLGSESLRLVPVNDQFEIDVAALERMIAADRAAGARPLAVVGGAGTVKTGAIDDLSPLADLCARENIWFHVDGAFGAVAALVPEFRTRLAGMERADSIAFDLHKWMYVPFEAGCVLVREAETHRHAFSVHPDYLARAERGLAGGAFWPEEYGMQLSRGFRALKVWLSFKEHGLDRYARLIAQNVAQARYLASLVERTPELELVAPVPLNIVCFRWVGDRSRDDAALDALNAELLMRLQERGIAAPSNATVRGRYALRVANTNHRTRREDMDLLVCEVCRIGAELS